MDGNVSWQIIKTYKRMEEGLGYQRGFNKALVRACETRACILRPYCSYDYSHLHKPVSFVPRSTFLLTCLVFVFPIAFTVNFPNPKHKLLTSLRTGPASNFPSGLREPQYLNLRSYQNYYVSDGSSQEAISVCYYCGWSGMIIIGGMLFVHLH